MTNIATSGYRGRGFVSDLKVDRAGRILVLGGPSTTESPNTLIRLTPDGDLDRSFSGDGMVTVGPGHLLALRQDGSIVVGGDRGRPPYSDLVFSRYTAAGRLDREFGRNGVARVNLARDEALGDLISRPRNRLAFVGYGYCPGRGCGTVVGLPTLGFLGPDGTVTRTRSGDYGVGGISGAPDGGIVASGVSTFGDGDFIGTFAAKYLPNGEPDPRFGRGGSSFVDADDLPGFYPANAPAQAQSTGAVLLVGQGASVIRFSSSGRLDREFAADCGQDPGNFDGFTVERVFVNADDSLIVTGGAGLCGIRRHMADGAPYPAFGLGGGVDPVATSGISALAAAVDPAERILIAGWDARRGAFEIARYTRDGQLDLGFGEAGVASQALPAPTVDEARGVALGRAGTVTVGGNSRCADRFCGDIAFVRYLRDGRLDPRFGGDGRVVDGRPGYDVIEDMLATPERRFLVGGLFGARREQGDIVGGGAAFARYLPGGRPDPSFSDDGIAQISDSAEMQGGLRAVALQRGGRPVGVGSCGPDCRGFEIVRMTPSGSLDRSFGNEGIVEVETGSDTVRQIAVQRDGKIVVAGGESRFILVRLLPNGRRDRSFGTRGIVKHSLRPRPGLVSALELLRRGRMLVAGRPAFHFGFGPGRPRSVIARLRPDGRLDRSFGDRGVARVPHVAATALDSGPCGRIAVAGPGYRRPQQATFAVSFLSANGKSQSARPALPFGNGVDAIAYDLAFDKRGRAVAAGTDSYDFAVARFQPPRCRPKR